MACVRGYLIIGCESAILIYDIKKQEQTHLYHLQMKLWKLFVAQGKCYGVVEDVASKNVSLQEYDVESNKWVHISDWPYQAKFGRVEVNEERLCIIGGTTADGQPTNYIQVYNFHLKNWMVPLPMSKQYNSCTTAISQSVVYIADQQDRTVEAIPLSRRAAVPPDYVPQIPFTSNFRLLSIQQQLFCIVEGSSTISVLYKAINKKKAAWQPFIEMPTGLLGVDACLVDNHSVAIMGTENHEGYKRGVLHVLKWK